MARVACVCGQLVTQFLINGEPRTSCPFCKRTLTFDSQGQIVGGKTEEMRAREAALPAKPSQALYPTSVAVQRSSTPAALVEVIQRHTSTQPARRFVDAEALQGHVDRLRAFVESMRPSPVGKLVCPHRPTCAVTSCHRAFSCGVLPRHYSGPLYIALWTLGTGLGVAALFATILAIVGMTVKPTQGNPPNLWGGAAFGAANATVAALAAFSYATLNSRARQRHIRGLARAAEEYGLQFWPLREMPPYAVPGFPVICPAPAITVFGNVDVAPRVKLAASGTLQGQAVYVAQYHYTCDPRDYQPMGSFLKVAQAIARPQTALHRQRITRIYLLTYFPEPLLHVPDLVITRERRDVDSNYLKLTLPHSIVTAPDSSVRHIFATTETAGGMPVCAKLLELLRHSPGYSIQVVGGRLLVWKGNCSPSWAASLPGESHTQELLTFASQVNDVLRKQAANR